jgi:hypothetical protein
MLRLALAQAALKRPDAAASTTRPARHEPRPPRRRTSATTRASSLRQGDPRKALALALENWKVQRELPICILAEAAAATGDAGGLGITSKQSSTKPDSIRRWPRLSQPRPAK